MNIAISETKNCPAEVRDNAVSFFVSLSSSFHRVPVDAIAFYRYLKAIDFYGEIKAVWSNFLLLFKRYGAFFKRSLHDEFYASIRLGLAALVDRFADMLVPVSVAIVHRMPSLSLRDLVSNSRGLCMVWFAFLRRQASGDESLSRNGSSFRVANELKRDSFRRRTYRNVVFPHKSHNDATMTDSKITHEIGVDCLLNDVPSIQPFVNRLWNACGVLFLSAFAYVLVRISMCHDLIIQQRIDSGNRLQMQRAIQSFTGGVRCLVH